MALLLPNLDDRRWSDLVDEGRALIPVYGREWTDHNAHDPGITLIELLAWIAEQDIYQLNQISDPERLKFLALVGIVPKPPLPARAVMRLGVTLPAGLESVTLPTGLEFEGDDPSRELTRFRTLHPITLVPGSLDVIQFKDAQGFHNLTPAWRRQDVMSPFGPSPQPGVEFYLGLSAALPINTPACFFFTFADGHSGIHERSRLLREAREIEKRCRPPLSDNPCKKAAPARAPSGREGDADARLKHHGVRTVWEFQALDGGTLKWVPLDPAKEEVVDLTRALTLDGTLTVRVPRAMARSQPGAVAAPYYLRCRFEAGAYDAAPSLRDIAFNGAQVEQAVPAGMTFVIDPRATIVYSPEGPPKPNDMTALRLELDSRQKVTRASFEVSDPADPKFLVLDYRAPSAGSTGVLNIEGVLLGLGTGRPFQEVTLPSAPVERASIRLYTLANEKWNIWDLRTDFYTSTRKDFHAVADASSGLVTFGNGETERMPPRKSLIVATYRTTGAEAGNLADGTIKRLADSPHNRAILYDPTAVPDGWKKLKPQPIVNPLPASGGAAAETTAHASGRAMQRVESSGRAVTLADYERLAARTPGTRIARVAAKANLHPDFPCFEAPGMITVIVVPYLPSGRPAPTPGLLHAVTAYLRPRRIIGTRVEVVGPRYLDVTVQASVQAKMGANKNNLREAIVTVLNGFLDPLTGGPEGTGWPFGRDVYRSEIMRVIAGVAGVDHVVSMDLVAGGCQPQCGNVCLGPTWLVAAGTHQITVL